MIFAETMYVYMLLKNSNSGNVSLKKLALIILCSLVEAPRFSFPVPGHKCPGRTGVCGITYWPALIVVAFSFRPVDSMRRHGGSLQSWAVLRSLIWASETTGSSVVGRALRQKALSNRLVAQILIDSSKLSRTFEYLFPF